MLTRRECLARLGATALGLACSRGGREAAAEAGEVTSVDALPLGRWVPFAVPRVSPLHGADLRWVYDSTAAVMVLFGGDHVCGQTYCRTTWTFDAGTNRWEMRVPDDAPKGYPAGRCQPGLAYDPIRARTWMFGGTSGRSPARQAQEGYPMGGLWEYSLEDNRWVDHGVAGLEDRSWSLWRRLYWDHAGGRLFLLGPTRPRGSLAGWSWTPGASRWERFGVSGDLPETWRTELIGASMPMAYDARRSRFVLLDTLVTLNGATSIVHTFIFDPRKASFRRVPGPQPPARRFHDLVHDEASDRVVLFGGIDGGGPRNDTWLFDPEAEAWTELKTASAAPPRRQHAMAYDVRHNVTLVYGGYGGDIEPKPYRVWALRLSPGASAGSS